MSCGQMLGQFYSIFSRLGKVNGKDIAELYVGF
jgi:hypothetical protein